jgi:hypothetical protein
MTPPRELIREITDNRAVAFFGSGLSRAARLPDWPGLLKDLADEAHKAGSLPDPDHADLIDWADKSDYLMLADAVINVLGRDRFLQSMKSRFTKAVEPTAVHRALCFVPFAAYITTNYDPLLEDAWSAGRHERLDVFTNADEQELRDPFRSGRQFLVKVHGDIRTPRTLVLGLAEFRRAIHNNRAYRIFLQDVFRRYTVLFLGYSLSDPDVLNILDELVSIFGEVPGRHFALVDAATISRLRAGVFARNYGIQVIRYEKTAPEHPEVLEFVNALVTDCAQEKRGRVALQIAGDAPPALTVGLNRLFRVEVGEPSQLISTPSDRPAVALAPVNAPRAQSMRDFCSEYVGAAAWRRLELWYQRLDESPEGRLLRLNLDRESARDDLESGVWAGFLRELAGKTPSPESPFAALTELITSGGRRYLLRGRKIETNEILCRYVPLSHFVNLVKAAEPGAGESAKQALAQIALEDSNVLQIGDILLGKPGGPSWCTVASFVQGRNAASIAADLWDSARGEELVEIRYAPDTLTGEDYLRVPAIPDIYNGRIEEANILKPPPGESDWCRTVRVRAGPDWKPLAPAAVHPSLKLSGTGVQRLGLRVVV